MSALDLTTEYLGLTLKNPLVVSSNPLSESVLNVRRMEAMAPRPSSWPRFLKSSSAWRVTRSTETCRGAPSRIPSRLAICPSSTIIKQDRTSTLNISFRSSTLSPFRCWRASTEPHPGGGCNLRAMSRRLAQTRLS